MGNILTPETPSVTTKIKTVLKKLDQHSAHISRRLNIIARETATIENRLKKNLQSRKSLGAGARRGYLAHEMSTQIALQLIQKRSQSSALTEVLQKVQEMQNSVRKIFCTLTKTDMLNEVAANLNKIPIGEVQSQVQEGNNTSTSAHRLMQQNIDKISELNLEADNTIHRMRTPETTQNTSVAVCSSVTDVLEEFMDVKEKEQMDKKALQTERMVKVKERMQNNATL